MIAAGVVLVLVIVVIGPMVLAHFTKPKAAPAACDCGASDLPGACDRVRSASAWESGERELHDLRAGAGHRRHRRPEGRCRSDHRPAQRQQPAGGVECRPFLGERCSGRHCPGTASGSSAQVAQARAQLAQANVGLIRAAQDEAATVLHAPSGGNRDQRERHRRRHGQRRQLRAPPPRRPTVVPRSPTGSSSSATAPASSSGRRSARRPMCVIKTGQTGDCHRRCDPRIEPPSQSRVDRDERNTGRWRPRVLRGDHAQPVRRPAAQRADRIRERHDRPREQRAGEFRRRPCSRERTTRPRSTSGRAVRLTQRRWGLVSSATRARRSHRVFRQASRSCCRRPARQRCHPRRPRLRRDGAATLSQSRSHD